MRVSIKDILLDKESYLYWVDKKIILTFKLISNLDKKQEIKEIFINHWFNLICNLDKHNVYNKKISLWKNIILKENEEKSYNVKIPIVIPDDEGVYTHLKNYIQIKINLPFLKEEVETKIEFLVKEYEKLEIKNITNYSWLNTYVKSDEFENHSDRKIAFKLKEYSNLDDNYIEVKQEIPEEIIENEEILEKENKVIFRNKFDSLFWSTQEVEFIEKSLLEKLQKESKFIRVVYYLINSKIYWYIYKYNLFLLVFLLIILLFEPTKVIFIITLVFFIISSVIIFWSKIAEKVFNYLIFEKVYSDIELKSPSEISKSINKKLKKWALSIKDIFKKFRFKINSEIDYNMSISLNTYLQSFYKSWDKIKHETDLIRWLELFNSKWHGLFNINDMSLLENNYAWVFDILLPSFKNRWFSGKNKIYYKLVVSFKSSYLPDYKKEICIDFDKKISTSYNFKEKLLKKSIMWVIVFIVIYLIIKSI